MQKKVLRFVLTVTLVGIVCAACQSQDTKEETAGAVLKGVTPVQEMLEEKEPMKESIPLEEVPVAPSADVHAEKPAEKKEQVVVGSGEEATEHLKKNMKEGKNEDVTFGSDGVLNNDELGEFYYVRLVSISLRLAGGTGSLDTYKVYQDGTFRTM